jgi:polysaccharide biosynthesis/export protein
MSDCQPSSKLFVCLGLFLIANLVPTAPALAQSSPATVSSARNPLTTGYFLGPGDLVQIEVFEYDEFKGGQTILPDGTITLPIVGQITATGLTTTQLTQRITQKLDPYLVNPVVTVTLVRLRPLRINVTGEVYRPGPTELVSLFPSSTDSQKPTIPTVIDALAQAGGVTNQADVRQVVLKRTDGEGREELFKINLWEALQEGGIVVNPTLRDGDALVVPRGLENNPLNQRLVARSTLSPGTIKVRVIGEVKRPGEVEISPDSNISAALAIAGGPTDKANLNKVKFARLTPNGTVQQQEINIATLTDTQQVQNGDVVIIPKRGFNKIFDTASTILSPFTSLTNLFFVLFR